MIDPLNVNIPLRGVKTELPILPEREYRLQCVESTIDPNNAQTGLNWNLTFHTTTPEVSVDGRDVPPGYKVFHICALQPKEDSKDREAFRRSLGEVMDAMDGTDETTRVDFTPDYARTCQGKFIRATLKIETYQGRQNNKLKNIKKAD